MAAKKKKLGVLYVPALYGEMGDWEYYSALMRAGDIATRIKVADQVHKSEKLADMIQRYLKGKRAAQIAKYLKEQKQRFFNSLVIGVYGGEPEWHAMQLKNAPRATISVGDVPLDVAKSFGVLGLSGKEQLFALDGQHRLAGIQHANKQHWLVEDEQIAVIFVAHRKTPEGLARTRRLFTTLNKTAKPVSTAERIVLDQDDAAAVCTRYLVDEFFGDGAIRIRGGDSLPQQDRQAFTGIKGLYEALRAYLPGKAGEDRRGFVHRVFEEKVLQEFCALSKGLFQAIGKAFPDIAPFWAGSDVEMKAAVAKYRRTTGGHLLFRPIGLVKVIEAASLRWGPDVDETHFEDIFEQLPMNFEELPFANVLWDTHKHRVDVRGKSRARDLLRYMMGDEDEGVIRRLSAETESTGWQDLPRLALGVAPKTQQPSAGDDESEDEDGD